MKTFLFSAALALCASALFAQEPVSTGFIRQVVPKTGVLVIKSDQNHQDITFFNADRATIFRADGKALTTADLEPGQRVTVKYGERNKKWYITQIILSEPRPGNDSVVANPAGRERIREATEGQARTPDAPADPAPAVVK